MNKDDRIDIDGAYEFKAELAEFVKRTRRRVMYEVLALIVIASLFGLDKSGVIPSAIKISTLIVIAAYILFGLAFYPKAKAIAANHSIYLLAEDFAFVDQDKLKRLPYRDLQITKIKKDGERVLEVQLRTSFNQTIKFRDLNNMQMFYEQLTAHLEHARRSGS